MRAIRRNFFGPWLAVAYYGRLSILLTVTLLMGFGFFMMARKGIWVPCIILAVVWLVHLLFFLFGVKTMAEEDLEE